MNKGILLACALLTFELNAQVEVYNEDFQSGLPLNYTLLNNDGLTPHASVAEFSNAWIALTDPENDADTIMGSTSYFDPAGQADRWLITPPITLGAYGNWAYWEAKSHDPSFPDTYLVLVSGSDTQPSSFTDTLFSYGGENPTWTSREGNLSELGFDNATIHLAFVNRTDDGFKLYIDDIRVEKENPLGLNEVVDDLVRVYPNPSSDYVYIPDNVIIDKAMVFTTEGQLLMESTASKLDIRALPNGVYLLQIHTSAGISHARFLKN
ncbi:MAG: hypothetical protein A3D92_19360 [Bacteroidetes bacterium RIFCSPHIGHO2_02_FULL_44_7]|nr:MAG: hypothetical protein A3D92_19360 [Bacteroidetes bacterium RIFCSPHIGHO2_02_FULL_44_7]